MSNDIPLMHVDDRPGLDDPVWEYVLQTRLRPYIETVRAWWSSASELESLETGIMELTSDLPGLYVRFTRTAIRSPIRGVQAFPFVLASALQITGIQGGAKKMVTRVCADNRFVMDEFTIIAKSNLPSVFSSAQFIAFVPTAILENTKNLGVWLYFTREEVELLAKGETNEAIRLKAMLKA